MDDEFNPDYDDCTLKAKDINLSDLCSSNLIDISLKRSSEYSDWLYIEFQRKCRSSSSIFLDYQITVWKSKNEKEYRLSSMRVAGKDFKEQTLFKDVPRRFDALMFKIFNESVKLVITDEDLKYFDEK
jgi:hypothetical protein